MDYWKLIQTLSGFWALGAFMTTEWNSALWDVELRFWLGIAVFITVPFVAIKDRELKLEPPKKKYKGCTSEDDDF